jgi:hypothetical protein
MGPTELRRHSVYRIAFRFHVRQAYERALYAFGITDLEKLSKKGRSFGVLSAYRSGLSKSQNQKRHGELIADLQKRGYKAETFKSQWDDMATGVTHKEKSIFIPKIDFETLHDLGKKYEQDAVLFKDTSGSIGVYFKDNTAVMAFNNETGEASVSKSTDPKQEYSRGRGVSFGLQLVEDRKFKHDGKKPVTQQEIVKTLKADKPEEGAKSTGDSDWWEDLSKPAQTDYCHEHPKSERCP